MTNPLPRNFEPGETSVHYWPYPGNGYHELTVLARSYGLDVVVYKGGSRCESVGVQAGHVNDLCAEMRRIADAPDPMAPVTERLSVIRDAMEVPVPADRDKWSQYTHALMMRLATVHGALDSLLDSEGTPASAAKTIRSYMAKDAIGYEPTPKPALGDGTAA